MRIRKRQKCTREKKKKNSPFIKVNCTHVCEKFEDLEVFGSLVIM